MLPSVGGRVGDCFGAPCSFGSVFGTCRFFKQMWAVCCFLFCFSVCRWLVLRFPLLVNLSSEMTLCPVVVLVLPYSQYLFSGTILVIANWTNLSGSLFRLIGVGVLHEHKGQCVGFCFPSIQYSSPSAAPNCGEDSVFLRRHHAHFRI